MIEQPLAMLAFALILSLGVERFLEILRALEQYRDARNPALSPWNARAKKIQQNVRGLLDNQRPETFGPLMLFFSRHLMYTQTRSGIMLVVSADAVRAALTRARYKLLSMGCGVALALVFKVNVFTLVSNMGVENTWLDSFVARDSLQVFGSFMTGIAIGFGSGPLHDIIVALERSRKSSDKGDVHE